MILKVESPEFLQGIRAGNNWTNKQGHTNQFKILAKGYSVEKEEKIFWNLGNDH